jgi:hypothetical protein
MTTRTPQVCEFTALYLQSHEGAAAAGAQFFRRVSHSHRSRAWGPEVSDLSREVAEDLRSLRRLMGREGVSRNLLLDAAMQAGELAGRLKPNGRLIRRSPLTDLVEVEGMLDAVRAKAAGWQALLAADPGRFAAEVEPLAERAEGQIDRLADLHRRVAAEVLGQPRS